MESCPSFPLDGDAVSHDPPGRGPDLENGSDLCELVGTRLLGVPIHRPS